MRCLALPRKPDIMVGFVVQQYPTDIAALQERRGHRLAELRLRMFAALA